MWGLSKRTSVALVSRVEKLERGGTHRGKGRSLWRMQCAVLLVSGRDTSILVLRTLKQESSLYCRMSPKYIMNPGVQSETLEEANKQDAMSCPSSDEKEDVGERKGRS